LAVPASVTRTVSSWSGTRFYVLRPFDNRVTVISLRPHLAGGVVLGDLTDPGFDMTATVATGGLLAVTYVSRHRPRRRPRTGSPSCHSAREPRPGPEVDLKV